jgi:hypothetical protein
MLSYTHYLAANSVNSERAVLMAIEAANAVGGVEGRPLQVVPRDTHSAAEKAVPAAQQLIDAVGIGLHRPGHRRHGDPAALAARRPDHDPPQLQHRLGSRLRLQARSCS